MLRFVMVLLFVTIAPLRLVGAKAGTVVLFRNSGGRIQEVGSG
jgi:hypothetical protein